MKTHGPTPSGYDGDSLLDEDREFLSRPIPAILSTVNPDGSPQQTVMWYRFIDDAFLFVMRTDRIKYRNIQHDPRASVMVVDPTNMWRWLSAKGTFSVDDREPGAFYRGLADHYLSGERLQAWQRYANFDILTVLRLDIHRVLTRYSALFERTTS